jgi:hypothetical protein
MKKLENRSNYKIRLRKGEFEVEVQGDKQWVEQKFEELTGEEKQHVFALPTSKEQIPKTLGEFLEMKNNPQKHTELVAVYAYWLLKAQKQQSFNVKDIISCYDMTRRAKPKNANQIINTDIKTNLFAVANETKDGYKAWFLTHKGEEFVKNL